MACNGICKRYKAIKPPITHTRYGMGQKRCSTCEVFINWDGKNCPCCGINLRTRPKGTKTREQLLIMRQIKRI